MHFDRGAMKREAKARMRDTRPQPIMVGLVVFALSMLISYLSANIGAGAIDLNEYLETGSIIESMNYNVGGVGILLTVALNIVSQIVSFGFLIYCIHVMRKEPSGFSNLLDGFAHIGKFLWLTIVTGVFVFLWSLLLLIPGIIAAYRYAMAPYLLAVHPDWKVMDCLRQSKIMMRGHKWELFVLELSFLGWNILCLFPPVMIYVLPYLNLTMVAFFNNLEGWSAPEEPTLPGGSEEKPPWEY